MKAQFWNRQPSPPQSASTIINSPIKIAVAGLLFMGTWTAIWGIFSKIPINVTGTGILVPSEGLMEVESPGSGMVLMPFDISKKPTGEDLSGKTTEVLFSPPTWSQQAYEFQWGSLAGKKSTKQAIELARSIVNTISNDSWARIDSSVRGINIKNLQEKYDGNIDVKKGDLVALIDNGSTRKKLITSLDQYKEAQRVLTNNKKILSQDLSNGINLLQSMQQRYEANAALLQEGAVDAEQVLRLKSDLINQKARNNDVARQIRANQQDAEQAADNLLIAVTNYLQSSAVYAMEDSRITAFNVGQRSTVQPGTSLMLLGWQKELTPDEVPIFLNERAFAQIAPGMSALATPIGFSSSEVGGIVGTVTSLETLPLSTESVSRIIAGLGSANLVQRGSASVYLATVQLKRSDSEKFKEQISRFRSLQSEDTTGGYVWNNNSRPPRPPREGILFDVQITTREMSPLEMLLPNLSELAGLSIPQRFTDLENNNPKFD